MPTLLEISRDFKIFCSKQLTIYRKLFFTLNKTRAQVSRSYLCSIVGQRNQVNDKNLVTKLLSQNHFYSKVPSQSSWWLGILSLLNEISWTNLIRSIKRQLAGKVNATHWVPVILPSPVDQLMLLLWSNFKGHSSEANNDALELRRNFMHSEIIEMLPVHSSQRNSKYELLTSTRLTFQRIRMH